MAETLFGMRLVTTTLDPIPRAMRTAPGIVVVSLIERDLLKDNDVGTLKRLLGIVLEDEFGLAKPDAEQDAEKDRIGKK